MEIDLAQSVIGFISGFAEGGRTGYQVKFLVRGVEYTFDSVKEVYDLRDSNAYFPYPCLGEELFLLHFDEQNILTGLTEVNDLKNPANPIPTGLSMGTMRMFKKQLTPETPAMGDIFRFENGRVYFDHFDENRSHGDEDGEFVEDNIVALSHKGNIHPKTGNSFKLAPDCVVYVWDWGTANHPFCKSTREQAKEWGFVEKFSLGSLEDVKRAYWVGFFATRGNPDEIDLIKCFPNRVPGFLFDEQVESWAGWEEN